MGGLKGCGLYFEDIDRKSLLEVILEDAQSWNAITRMDWTSEGMTPEDVSMIVAGETGASSEIDDVPITRLQAVCKLRGWEFNDGFLEELVDEGVRDQLDNM